jgi:poly(A) polymerase
MAKLSPAQSNKLFSSELVTSFQAKLGSDLSKFRFVGGCVRDLLADRPIKDIDLATSLNPDEAIALLAKYNIKTIPTGKDFGSITAFLAEGSIEITSLRKDIKTDGRHAIVEYSKDWQEDSARRDFTINAIYLDFDGEIFDYHHGMEDLQNHIVKFIGNPIDRIKEDVLRILRFFRFSAEFADSFDAEAIVACHESAHLIPNLSGERIRSELWKILESKNFYIALQQMRSNAILDNLFEIDGALLNKLENQPVPALHKLALLLITHPIAHIKEISTRLKLANKEKGFVLTIAQSHKLIATNLSIAAQKKLIRKFSKELFIELVTIKNIYAPNKVFADYIDIATKWEIPTLPVNGSDLMKLGFKEGAELGMKLKKLEAKWEESDYRLNKEDLLLL